MTRKRFNKLCVALVEKMQYKYAGKHMSGKDLKFYNNRTHMIGTVVKKDSYAEAWETLKPIRDLVGM